MTNDQINHPKHYQTADGIEAIDVLEQYGLGLHLGTAMAHLLRAGKKHSETEREDVEKARWWVKRWLVFEYCPGVAIPEASDDAAGGLAWRTPEQIADAFGLDGARRDAVCDILEAAAFGDETERVTEALHWINEDIERLTVAALPRAYMASA